MVAGLAGAVSWRNVGKGVGYGLPLALLLKLNYDLHFGDTYAMTVTGTDVVMVGKNYFDLHPMARTVVDAHEAVHQNQDFCWAWRNRREAEVEAYTVQRDLARNLLDNWWTRTGLPANHPANGDLYQLWNDAVEALKEYGQ